MMPRVSVVMPVYNVEAYLRDAIECILRQSFQDFEFLIMDDCSTDNTLNILKHYRKKDPRIRVFKRLGNVGITKNLNYLMRHARGEFIARMDGDDLSVENRFQKQVDLLTLNNEIDLVWSAGNIIFEDGARVCSLFQPAQEDVIRLLADLKRNYIAHPSVMFRNASVISKLGGYNEQYRTGQDGDLWNRMIKNNMTLQRIDEELVSLRSRRSSVTALRTNRSVEENVVKAKICLNNRQYSESLKYISRVGNFWGRGFLYLRYLIGEDMVDMLNKFRKHRSYDEQHKFTIMPEDTDIIEII